MNPEVVSPDSVEAYWCALESESTAKPSAASASLPEEFRLLNRLHAVRQLLNSDSTARCVDQPTTVAASESSPLEVGTDVDGYRITRMLGRGGMAVVYAAEQLALGRDVALKLIRTGPLATSDDLARFASEATATAGLQHPCIVSVYDTGVWQGLPYFSMQLVEGPTLSQELSGNPMEPREAAQLGIKIGAAVQHAHERGILHRDLKPSNVLVDRATGQPFVADFGLAKLFAADEEAHDLTASGDMVGTPSYMSPEQALGDSKRVSPASDVYSLGAILYEMLTGRAPFRAASPIETARQVIEQQPVAPQLLNATIPRDLQTICLKALAKEPKRRYSTAADLTDDLQRFLDGRPIEARPTSAFDSAWLWSKRNRALATTSSLLIATMLLGTVASSTMWLRSERNAARAVRMADDLQQNRQRLRNSVSRFQAKILSDQALHLQMNSDLRREMFDDVIEYLDEFATLASDEMGFDRGLTEDYLSVAEAALEIGELHHAGQAARRALAGLESVRDSQEVGTQLLLHNATRVALLANEDLVQPEAIRLLDDLQAASHRAVECDPDHRAAQLADLQSRFLLILHTKSRENPGLASHSGAGGNPNVRNPQQLNHAGGFDADQSSLDPRQRGDDAMVDRADRESSRSQRPQGQAVAKSSRRSWLKLMEDMELFQQRESHTALDIESARLACEIAWQLSEASDSETAMAALERINSNWLEHLRECLFAQKRPVHQYNFLKGVNICRQAILEYRSGDETAALELFEDASHDLRRATEGSPQNRKWIAKQAECNLRVAELRFASNRLDQAGVSFENAIRQYVRLIQSDAEDLAARKRIIMILSRLGELEQRQEDFLQAAKVLHTASNDCRLLLNTDAREWAFRTRLWLLSQVVHCYSKLEEVGTTKFSSAEENRKSRELFDEIETIFRDTAPEHFPEFDTSKIDAILSGNFVPVKPESLELAWSDTQAE